MTESLEDSLDRLQKRRRTLQERFDAQKRAAAELHKQRTQSLDRQQQRVRKRLSDRQRRIEARRKILIGAWMLHETEQSPDAADRLRQGLDRFLRNDRDRLLFNLPPLPADNQDRKKTS